MAYNERLTKAGGSKKSGNYGQSRLSRLADRLQKPSEIRSRPFSYSAFYANFYPGNNDRSF